MDPSDWLRSPQALTPSKRPSPSPSEGDNRDGKRARTQLDDSEADSRNLTELPFAFTNFPDDLNNQSDTFFNVGSELSNSFDPFICSEAGPTQKSLPDGQTGCGSQPDQELAIATTRVLVNRYQGNSPQGLYQDHGEVLEAHEEGAVPCRTHECNTCFGVLIESPLSNFSAEEGIRSELVTLKPFGDVLVLRSQRSSRHAGILNNPGLVSTIHRFQIRLDATLIIPAVNTGKDFSSSRRSKQTKDLAGDYSLRIVVHGQEVEKEAVGRHLSDAGLFLQHPSATEVLPEARYDNPHYLLPPGAEMPRIEDLDLGNDDDIYAHADAENGNVGSHILRVFDTAHSDATEATLLAVSPSPRLRSELMSHQITALNFMLEKERGFVDNPLFPALWRQERSRDGRTLGYRHAITRSIEPRPHPPKGGILADDMGLGKTLSILALICSSLDLCTTLAEQAERQSCRGTLIIAPKSAINSWEIQASEHIHKGEVRVVTYHGTDRGSLAEKLWETDVVITTYETLRSDYLSSGRKSALYSRQWLRVVLDEAHHIRNRSSQAFESVSRLESRYRWCLTGTPVHNSLDDYGALLSFVRVHPFQKKPIFMLEIVKPLEEKQTWGVHRLQMLIRATCLRRTKRKTLASGEITLPRRLERPIRVKLHQQDQDLYLRFKRIAQDTAAGLNKRLQKGTSVSSKEENVLAILNTMRLICDHGEQLVPLSMKRLMGKDLVPYFNACSTCEGEIDRGSPRAGALHSLCNNCASSETTPSSFQLQTDLKRRENLLAVQSSSQRKSESVKKSVKVAYRPSAKVTALLENLQQNIPCMDPTCNPRKSVVFSYWNKMLDLIEQALHGAGIEYQRIDGQSSLEDRRLAMAEFGARSDCTVMLASIGSAAEGVDLTTASVVHLMEPHWNPMVEAQAVDRVYRIGQKQEVTIIRYIVPGSIETYVQFVQEQKIRMINQMHNLDSDDTVEAELSLEKKKALDQVLS